MVERLLIQLKSMRLDKMKTKHTPVPWHRNGIDLTNIISGNYHGYKSIANFHPGSNFCIPIGEALANCKFAIKAVNNHQGMINVLKSCQNAIKNEGKLSNYEILLVDEILKYLEEE